MNAQDTSRADWLDARRGGIGGSDVAAICGLSKWGTPLSVYLDKIGASPDSDNRSMARGRYMEAAVCAWYADHHLGVSERIHDDGDHVTHEGPEPWILGSYDRLVGFTANTGAFTPTRGLEAKTARYSDDWGDDGSDQVPAYYRVQCQWYMLVSGLPRWDVALYVAMSDEFRCYHLEAHKGVQRALYTRARAFWFDHVEAANPPPLHADDTSSRIAQLYPAVVRPMRDEADDEQADMLDAAMAAKDAADAAKAEWNQHKARICREIGDGYGLESDTVRATWSGGKSRRFTITRKEQ